MWVPTSKVQQYFQHFLLLRFMIEANSNLITDNVVCFFLFVIVLENVKTSLILFFIIACFFF